MHLDFVSVIYSVDSLKWPSSQYDKVVGKWGCLVSVLNLAGTLLVKRGGGNKSRVHLWPLETWQSIQGRNAPYGLARDQVLTPSWEISAHFRTQTHPACLLSPSCCCYCCRCWRCLPVMQCFPRCFSWSNGRSVPLATHLKWFARWLEGQIVRNDLCCWWRHR